MKKNNPALWNGAYGAQATRIKNNSTGNDILAFSRKKDDNEVIVILNLSDSVQSFQPENQYFDNNYKNAFEDGNTIKFSDENGPTELDAWSYLVLTSNNKN